MKQREGKVLENTCVKRELRHQGKATLDTTDLLLIPVPGQLEKGSGGCRQAGTNDPNGCGSLTGLKASLALLSISSSGREKPLPQKQDNEPNSHGNGQIGSDQKDTGTVEEKQSFPLQFVTKKGKLVPEALREQTSNGWEDRRVLGPKTEEVNDSDSLKCSSSYVTGRGVGRSEEPGDERKRQKEEEGDF